MLQTQDGMSVVPLRGWVGQLGTFPSSCPSAWGRSKPTSGTPHGQVASSTLSSLPGLSNLGLFAKPSWPLASGFSAPGPPWPWYVAMATTSLAGQLHGGEAYHWLSLSTCCWEESNSVGQGAAAFMPLLGGCPWVATAWPRMLGEREGLSPKLVVLLLLGRGHQGRPGSSLEFGCACVYGGWWWWWCKNELCTSPQALCGLASPMALGLSTVPIKAFVVQSSRRRAALGRATRRTLYMFTRRSRCSWGILSRARRRGRAPRGRWE